MQDTEKKKVDLIRRPLNHDAVDLQLQNATSRTALDLTAGHRLGELVSV